MKEKRTCNNCINGTAIPVNSDILCRYNGAVSPDFVCSKHRFMPSTRSHRDKEIKCMECENFILEFDNAQNMPTIGICKLFTVRQYDGRHRNACSKFSKKTELEVS